MTRWLFIIVLVVQAHFAASYLVPLDAQAQTAFGGLLRWAWPWAVGDRGPLGEMTSKGFPIAGFFLAMTTAAVLFLAAFACLRIWVPFAWWRALAVVGAIGSLLLMMLFFGLTKVVPIATAVVILAAGFGYWSPIADK